MKQSINYLFLSWKELSHDVSYNFEFNDQIGNIRNEVGLCCLIFFKDHIFQKRIEYKIDACTQYVSHSSLTNYVNPLPAHYVGQRALPIHDNNDTPIIG